MFVDIGIIVILLIGLIVGIVRGTAKSLIKLLSLVGGLVLTWFLAPYVMKFVFDIPLLNNLIIGEKISLKALFADANIATLTESSFILKTVCTPLQENIGAILAAKEITAITVEQIMPYALAVYSATVFVSFLVYLVVRLLIMIIAAIIKAIFIKNVPGGFSRFIGAILGLVNSVVAIMWIFMLTSAIIGMPALTEPISSQTNGSLGVSWTYEFFQAGFNEHILTDEQIVKYDYIEHACKAAASHYEVEWPEPGSGTEPHTHSGVYVCDGCGDSFVGEWSEFLSNYEDNVATVTTEEYYVVMSADVENNRDVELLCATVDDTIGLLLTYDADSQIWIYAYVENDGGANLTAGGTFASFSAGDSLTYLMCDFADFAEIEPTIKSAIATIVSNANSSLSEKNAGFTMANLGLN